MEGHSENHPDFAEKRNDTLCVIATLALFPTAALALWSIREPVDEPIPTILSGPVFLLNLMLAGIFYLSAKR